MGALGLVVLASCALLLLFVVGVTRDRARSRSAQRAELLLAELLTSDELAELDARGFLEVPSRAHPGRRYRVPACPGWVAVVQDGQPFAWLCLRPRRALPPREMVLVHKLMLEADEEAYWRLANRVS